MLAGKISKKQTISNLTFKYHLSENINTRFKMCEVLLLKFTRHLCKVSKVADKWSTCIHSILAFGLNSQRSFLIFFHFFLAFRSLFINKYIRRCADVHWPVRCILLCAVWHGQQPARVTRGTSDWGPQGYEAKPQRGNTISFQYSRTGKLIKW